MAVAVAVAVRPLCRCRREERQIYSLLGKALLAADCPAAYIAVLVMNVKLDMPDNPVGFGLVLLKGVRLTPTDAGRKADTIFDAGRRLARQLPICQEGRALRIQSLAY